MHVLVQTEAAADVACCFLIPVARRTFYYDPGLFPKHEGPSLLVCTEAAIQCRPCACMAMCAVICLIRAVSHIWAFSRNACLNACCLWPFGCSVPIIESLGYGCEYECAQASASIIAYCKFTATLRAHTAERGRHARGRAGQQLNVCTPPLCVSALGVPIVQTA